jgi:hypothetical protein
MTNMHHSKLWRICVWNQCFEVLYESITKCKPMYDLFKDQNIVTCIKVNNVVQDLTFFWIFFYFSFLSHCTCSSIPNFANQTFEDPTFISNVSNQLKEN